METVQETVEVIKPRVRDMDRVYQSVNAAWGKPRRELPPLTTQEAIAAYRRLWKVATGSVAKPTKIRITHGNRHNYIRVNGGVCILNPDRGWWSLVHSIAHRKRHAHGPLEANLEKRLIQHVVENGWLDGALKRLESEKAKPDMQQVRYESVLAKLKRWETKAKRAETAIKKLTVQKRYYERQLELS